MLHNGMSGNYDVVDIGIRWQHSSGVDVAEAKYERTVFDVVETLKNAHERETPLKCSLLIGAGCSASAGIPLAGGFIDEIEKRYPEAYAYAREKTYPHCMAALSVGERRALIREHIKKSRINHAHLAIAQLIKNGFVDRVLTTNFDPLVARACALCNIPIAVYDFAATQTFDPGDAPDLAVFHLHGQHTGFRLLNTEHECNSLEQAIAPLFDDSGRGRTWIVAGYSGENDPVFRQLTRVERFDHRLYWVGYQESPPSADVLSQLLTQDKYAFYVPGHDADGFFSEVAHRLGCFPPDIVLHPFAHLKGVYDSLQPPKAIKFNVDLDTGRRLIERAIDEFETDTFKRTIRAEAMIAHGQYADARAELTGPKEPLSKEERELVALTHLLEARHLLASGDRVDARELINEKGKEALETGRDFSRIWCVWGDLLREFAEDSSNCEDLLDDACDKYERSTDLEDGNYEAYNHWAGALAELARMTEGDEGEQLFRDACAKCEQAIDIEPELHQAYQQFGDILADRGRAKGRDGGEMLFVEARAKYEQAILKKPDLHEAYRSLGNMLVDLAQLNEGEKRQAYLREACGQYEQATKTADDKHEAHLAWGNTLVELARSRPEDAEKDERKTLLRDACIKYERAAHIKPDAHDAYYKWANALAELARIQEGERGDDREDDWEDDWEDEEVDNEHEVLLRDACAKYEQATQIKPDMHEAYCNWGTALTTLARIREGGWDDWQDVEQETLFRDACEKYEQATKIKPDTHEAYYNWGITLARWAWVSRDRLKDPLLRDACAKYEQATRIEPGKHEAFYNWGITLSRLAQGRAGDERETLLRDAGAKYGEATRIKPDKHEAFYNWGITLDRLAQMQEGDEREESLRDACSKYEQATQIKTDKHEAYYNWGNTLDRLAQMRETAEREALLHEACDKYERATKIKRDKHWAFYQWGNKLMALAQMQEADERAVFLRKACDKYRQATRVRAGWRPFRNWGDALIEMARMKEGEERDALLDQAQAKLQVGEEHRRGSCAYGLACIAALQEDAESCRNWLKLGKKYGALPNAEHMRKNADLKSVRRRHWYQQLLKDLEEDLEEERRWRSQNEATSSDKSERRRTRTSR